MKKVDQLDMSTPVTNEIDGYPYITFCLGSYARFRFCFRFRVG